MNTQAVATNGAQIHNISRRKKAPRSVTLSKAIAMAYRQRYVLIAAIGGALLIGALVTLFTAPRYTAQASIQLDQERPNIIPDGDIQPEVRVQESERFLQTQLDRILSRSTAAGVASRLEIASNPELLSALGFDEGDIDLTEESIISTLQDNVTAALGLNTRLAQITYTSFDRDASAEIANAYAEQVSSNNLLSRSEDSAQAEQFLSEQLAEAKKKLEDSEREMLAYARDADLTTTIVADAGSGGDRGGSLRAQQLGQLTDSLADATARRIEAEQNWRQVANISPMALPEVQSNRAIQDLLGERAALEVQIAEEQLQYTSEYPGAAAASDKKDQIDNQIDRLAENIKQSYRSRYNASLQAERQLRGAIGQLRQSAMAERERSVNFNALQREVDTNRAFYDGLLERYTQVAAASSAPGENIRIVDRAKPPESASAPNVLQNLALSGILGLIAALGIGLLRERSSTVVRSPEDAEQHLDITGLGAVPAFGKGEDQDSAILNPRSPQAEAYFSAAVALHRMSGTQKRKVFLVTSTTPGEGKSTSSIGVARSLGAMGKRVVLIDGDLRRPSLGMMLGQPIGAGLGEVLAGETSAEDATRQIAETHGFNLITAGESKKDPVSLLSADNLVNVLDQLAEDYDMVVIDGPPIMGIADSVLLAEHSDAGAYVIEANSKDIEELETAISRLPDTLPLGAIVTKFDPRIAGVKYGRQSYYSY
ncbi:MAG: polysaccharide biosynthesis tyrosine autokinase [Pseudomonadota bacterium]